MKACAARAYRKHRSKRLAYAAEKRKTDPEKHRLSVRTSLDKGRRDPAWVEARRVQHNGWVDRNRESYNANRGRYQKMRRETDANYLIKTRLRSRVYGALHRKRIAKSASTIALVGCSIEFLRGYLESRFQTGMTWANTHIDHHIPCAEFDLRDPAQQRQCFNYKNLKPMFARDNLRKGAKVPPGPHQAELI